jgi:VWFA-related protein
LRLGVLLDTSTSAKNSGLFVDTVAKSIQFVQMALINFNDQAFILTFADSPEATGFMNREQFLKFKLDVTPGGGTALYDSIVLACSERMMKLDASEPAHLVLIVISDGDDNRSHFSLDHTIAVAQQAGVVIFTISGRQIGVRRRGNHVLKALADATGGEFLSASRNEFPEVFRKIQQQIENTYVAIYTPADEQRDSHFRPVEIKISDKKLKVRAARGYFSRTTM